MTKKTLVKARKIKPVSPVPEVRDNGVPISARAARTLKIRIFLFFFM
jgi:hypothetical protein